VPVQENRPKIITTAQKSKQSGDLKEISIDELSKHSNEDDCWVAIFGYVYDLTSFAEEHPAGAESIYKLGGKDGTEAFQSVHNEGMMEDFQEVLIGKLV